MLYIDAKMPKDCAHCFACEVDICNCAITGHKVGDNVLVFHNRPDDCPIKYVEGLVASNDHTVLNKIKADIVKNRDRDITGSGEITSWLEGYRTAFNETLAIIELNQEGII